MRNVKAKLDLALTVRKLLAMLKFKTNLWSVRMTDRIIMYKNNMSPEYFISWA